MAVSAQMRTQVSQLYVAMFGRAPDGEGLGFWVQQLSSGQSLTSVADTMFAVPTARAYYPSFMTNGEMVTSFYANVLNRTPDLEGFNFWTGKLNAGVTPGSVINQLIFAVTSYTGTDPVVKASKDLFMNKVTVAQAYGESNGTVAGATTILGGVTADATTVTTAKAQVTAGGTTGGTTALTTSPDALTGTASDDTFVSYILDNANTLQSGDVIKGGAGNDRLEADIGNSQKFAITATTDSVETIAIRGQAIAVDTNNNNMVNVSGDVTGNQVQIDAQRMSGVTQWESNNSRADVVIEDVRIAADKITKDITIAMVQTDPGHVDFGVYFDQYSLRAQTNKTATLTLELMDTRNASAGNFLKDNPYDVFKFNLTAAGATTSTPITVNFGAVNGTKTYADLLTAIQTAIKAVPALASFTAALGNSFTAKDTISGNSFAGKTIVLTSTAGGTVDTVGGGWMATGVVAPSSGLHVNINTATVPSTDLITSKIILDDVGRGSTGGDLVVGGLSVGDTSSSQGVQRFEIEVRDNSKLETINSTNNTLKEVAITSGVTDNNFAYLNGISVVNPAPNAGNLTVNGVSGTNGANVTTAGVSDPQTGENAPLPGSKAQTENGYGFSDVQKIDASAFKGQLAFSAEVTKAAVDKYLNSKDGSKVAATPGEDNIAFTYTGGTNNDTMFVQLSSAVLASANHVTVGREDFSFTADGGAGDDTITLRMVDKSLTGAATEAWYNNQHNFTLNKQGNVTVNGGDGNDTIRTLGAGDVTIDGGAGTDTVYADNTGAVAATAANVRVAGVTVALGVAVVPVAVALTGGAGVVVGAGSNATAAATAVANATDNLAVANAALATATQLTAGATLAASDVVVAKANLASANAVLTALNNAVKQDADLAKANEKAVFVFNTSNQATAYTAGIELDRKVTDLKSDANDTYNLFKATLTVNFKGFTSAAVTIGSDAATYKTSDLYINQALKLAINNDAVLSKLLVATDGPGHTLVVTSLIDGQMAAGDVGVSFTAPAATDFTATEATAIAKAWAVPAITDVATLVSYMNTGVAGSGGALVGAGANAAVVSATVPTAGAVAATTASDLLFKGDYFSQLADTGVAGGTVLAGAASTSVSDHIITGGAGNDVIVLGTTVGADILTSSNDTVKFAGTDFGKDTIVNFAAAGTGADILDLTALGGAASGSTAATLFTAGALWTSATVLAASSGAAADKSISIFTTTGTTDTAATLTAGYAAAAANNATAATHVLIGVDTVTHIGSVYSVVDAAGATSTGVATLVGTISLGNAFDWTTLSATNFA